MLILVVPVSSGHLARRLLAGPVEVNGQREVTNSLWWWQPFVLHHHSAGAALFVLINQLSGGGASFRLCCGSESPPSTTRTPQSIARPAAIRKQLDAQIKA